MYITLLRNLDTKEMLSLSIECNYNHSTLISPGESTLNPCQFAIITKLPNILKSYYSTGYEKEEMKSLLKDSVTYKLELGEKVGN